MGGAGCIVCQLASAEVGAWIGGAAEYPKAAFEARLESGLAASPPGARLRSSGSSPSPPLEGDGKSSGGS